MVGPVPDLVILLHADLATVRSAAFFRVVGHRVLLNLPSRELICAPVCSPRRSASGRVGHETFELTIETARILRDQSALCCRQFWNKRTAAALNRGDGAACVEACPPVPAA